jgi:hypothetical protein
MAQQDKQVKAGSREGFACRSVKLAFWPTEAGMRLIPIRFF